MFKKILLRSVAGATAIGSALAVSLVATPAVMTSAPEIRNVACTVKYPGSVSTTTQLSLGRSVGFYGVANSATATVSQDEVGAKAPAGRVRFRLLNPNGSVQRAWTVALRGGEATVGLPRRLGAQSTYGVDATYLPPDCSVFAGSSSNTVYYTVEKADTRSRVSAPEITRGEKARVNVVLGSPSPYAPGGRVRIVVKRRANVLASQTVRLAGGEAFAAFRKFRPGVYDVDVVYLGTGNFARSRGGDDLRVTRR